MAEKFEYLDVSDRNLNIRMYKATDKLIVEIHNEGTLLSLSFNEHKDFFESYFFNLAKEVK
jgi:hypothetical protein